MHAFNFYAILLVYDTSNKPHSAPHICGAENEAYAVAGYCIDSDRSIFRMLEPGRNQLTFPILEGMIVIMQKP